jgi:hypothetical protein
MTSARAVPLVNDLAEFRRLNGKVLGSVIEGAVIRPPGGHSTTDAACFFNDPDRVSLRTEFPCCEQSRDSRPEHHNIQTIGNHDNRTVYSAFGFVQKEWE